MALYESVLIARQDVSSAQVDGLVETFQNIITENGGKIEKTENWGLRTMAYKVKKNRKGHYVLMNIDAPSEAVQEMERQMRINEDILRYMTLRVDEHETEPSVVMRNKGSEDRPRGRGRYENSDRGDDRKPAPAADAAPTTEETASEGETA